MGGNPYLPKNEAYPIGKSSGDPLPLLLQLNLSHIKLPGYPNKGILEIFMDNKGYPTDYEIKYFKTVDEKNYQKEFPKLNFDTKNPLYFEKGYKIKLIKTYDYMYSLDYRFNELLLSIVNKVYGLKLKELDDFEEDDDDVWEEYIHNNIKGLECTFGGYPDFTQQDPRESDAKRGDECLLKMESIGDEYFGDLGVVSVLIDKKYIKSKKFEKGVLDWDCT